MKNTNEMNEFVNRNSLVEGQSKDNSNLSTLNSRLSTFTSRLSTLVLIVFCLLFGGKAWADQLVVNDGTTTSSYQPINGLYVDTQGAASEFVIPATTTGMSDMKYGTITKMAFHISTVPTTWGSPTIQLYIGEVDGTTLNSIGGPSSFTVVATGVWSNQSSTLEVTLSTPYTYEGGNLLIGTYVQTASSTYKTTYFYGVSAASGSSRHRTSSSGNGSADSFLPKVTFTYTPGVAPTCPKPTDLTFNLTPGNGTIADLSWTENGTATNWVVEYATNSSFTSAQTKNVSGSSSTQLTGLTAETTYYARVKANCGGGDESDWSSTCEFTPTNVYAITVNDGSSTNGNVPIYGLWCDDITKSQFIIPSTALSTIQYGTINKLTFYSSNASVSWGSAKFEVYMTETNETSISELVDYASMTKVMTAGSLSISGNIMEVTLSSPYQYLGGNLMIGFLQTVSGSYSSCSWYGVTATGASMGGYGTSISQQNFLPKTTINYTPGVAPTCPKPTNLTVSNITSNSATVSWDGEADSYNVRYRIPAQEQVIFFDGFESGSLDGWTVYTLGDDPYGWRAIDASSNWTNHGENYSASSFSWNSNAYNADNWLISPQVSLQGMLKFWVYSNYADEYEVLLSTTGIATNNFTNTLKTMAAAPGTWTEITIDLSSYSGQGYIAIHHVFYDGNVLLVDDFGIYRSVAASSWEETTTSENSITINGLTSEMEYEWQVQSDCGSDGESNWSQISTFTTLSPCAIPTGLTADALSSSATLSWSGVQENYNVEYRAKAYFNDFNSQSSDGWTYDELWIYGFRDPIYNIPGSANYFMTMGWSSTSEEVIISSELPAYESGAYVEFYYFGYSVSNTFQVGYSSTTNDPSAFTWGNPINAPLQTYTMYREALAAGIKYVAFKATASSQGASIFIDNFGIYKSDWVSLNSNEATISASNLIPNSEYIWRVQGVNCDGNDGTTDWSNYSYFTTLPEYTVNASVVPVAAGTITGEGFSNGSGVYTQGTTCTLTAPEDDCYTFVNWTENGTQVSTNATYSFTVTGNRTLVANFTLNSHTVTVNAGEGGSASQSGNGTYDCGTTCTVSATAGDCYNFVNWTENGTEVSTDAEYAFTVTSDRNLVANFEEWTLSIDNASSSLECINSGTEIVLTATATSDALADYSWAASSGSTTGTDSDNTYTVSPTALSNTYTVSATVGGCERTQTATITTKPIITRMSSSEGNEVCFGLTTELTATCSDANATFSWNSGAGTGSSWTTPAITTSTNVVVVATSANGCAVEENMTVTPKVPTSSEISAMGAGNGYYIWTGKSENWSLASSWMIYSTATETCTPATAAPTTSKNVAVGKYGTCVSSSSTLNINASAKAKALKIGADVTVSGSSTLTIAGSLTNNGTFEAPVVFNNTTTLYGTGSTTFSSVTINEGKTLKTSGHNITISGDFTNNGTLTAGAGSITMTGNLINNGTFKTGAGALSLNGNLTNSGTFTIGGAGAVTLTGNWTNNGTFTPTGAGAVIFAGTSSQVIGGSNATTFKNVQFSNNLTISTQPTITGAVTFSNGIITGDITLGNASTVSGASTNSYVNGKVTKNMKKNTTFTFPIGAASLYAPFEAKSSVASNVSVQYASGNEDMPDWWNHSGNFNNVGLDHASDRENWQVSASATTNLSNIKLYWNATSGNYHSFDEGTDALESCLRVAAVKKNGFYWQNLGQSAIEGDFDGAGSITAATPLAITVGAKAAGDDDYIVTFASTNKGNLLLPIDLTSFTATCDGRSTFVEWTTATEKNNDYFSLERSDDAINFVEIARIAGAGNSIDPVDYAYTDYGIHGGDNYYRLVQVDYDGTRTISDIVVANCVDAVAEDPEVMSYPNPFSGELTLVLDNFDNRAATIEVYDMLGKLIYTEKVSAPQNSYETILNLSNLPSGAYNVRVSTADFVINKNVIKS